MRERYLWLAIAVLLIITLGQSCYIYVNTVAAKEAFDKEPLQPEIRKSYQAEKIFDTQWEEFEKWRSKVQKQLRQGEPLLERDFDGFFNDRFFSRKLDPFAEIEKIRWQMPEILRGDERTLFDGYWDKWFEQRMRMGQFKTEIVRAADKVTIIIYVPGLETNTADITDNRVKISFTTRTASEGKDRDTIIKRYSSQSYVKILPIPDDAAAGTGRAEMNGECIKIRFDSK